ncbi:MAG: hypothetical protein ACP5NB_06470, partial [Chloroflexia bacterium]
MALLKRLGTESPRQSDESGLSRRLGQAQTGGPAVPPAGPEVRPPTPQPPKEAAPAPDQGGLLGRLASTQAGEASQPVPAEERGLLSRLPAAPPSEEEFPTFGRKVRKVPPDPLIALK